MPVWIYALWASILPLAWLLSTRECVGFTKHAWETVPERNDIEHCPQVRRVPVRVGLVMVMRLDKWRGTRGFMGWLTLKWDVWMLRRLVRTVLSAQRDLDRTDPEKAHALRERAKGVIYGWPPSTK